VDDVFVGGEPSPLAGGDIWTAYMRDWRAEDNEIIEDRGWCVDKKRYDGEPHLFLVGSGRSDQLIRPERNAAAIVPPCPPDAPISFQDFPFTLESESSRCLPPYPLLTTRTWSCPCPSRSQVCIRPLPEEGITRIQWISAESFRAARGDVKKVKDESQVLLWKGDRRMFWETVRVGRWGARGGKTGRRLLRMFEVILG
jgi:hypothetical protein